MAIVSIALEPDRLASLREWMLAKDTPTLAAILGLTAIFAAMGAYAAWRARTRSAPSATRPASAGTEAPPPAPGSPSAERG
jgi:hypothetical protein